MRIRKKRYLCIMKRFLQLLSTFFSVKLEEQNTVIAVRIHLITIIVTILSLIGITLTSCTKSAFLFRGQGDIHYLYDGPHSDKLFEDDHFKN